MAKTMKAAVVREFGKPLVIEDAPIDEVGPRARSWSRLRQPALYHTDLHAAEGDWPVKPKPALHSWP